MLLPRIAGWLNGGFSRSALIATIACLLPAPIGPSIGAAVVVFRVLSKGLQDGLIVAVIAIVGYGIFNQVVLKLGGIDQTTWSLVQQQFVLFCFVAILAAAFANVIRQLGSTTLATQISIIVACVVLVAMLVAGLPLQDWYAEMLILWEQQLKAAGQPVDFSAAQPLLNALLAFMTVWVVWLCTLIAGFIGYTLYGSLAAVEYRFGRFRELSFGRVIAAVLAFVCLAASLSNSPTIVAVAILLLAMFIVNGIALMHWVVASRRLMPGLLLLIYISLMIPVINAFSVLTLAVLGYFDAWFDLRKRFPAASV